ncbi:MAG: hypothetical protein HDT28_06215 [Clostridiales bacterium]|nr:hypothetical protein [Clostridiales bacterium]
MKEKRTYSLTAKERKQKRIAAENKAKGASGQQKATAPVKEAPVETRESEERAMAVAQKRSKTSALVVGAVVGVAIILLITALLVPVILLFVNPYRGQGEVVARFNLSNGMTLEYVIDEDDYDTAATNFIFLAKNKFFDNTVFYDVQNGWLRFGGYEAPPEGTTSYNTSHHKGDSESYINNFSALPNNRFDKAARKFGYRLNADKNGRDEKQLNKEGILTFRYSDSATEFQMTYREQATNQLVQENGDNSKTYDVNSTMVGHALNQKTIENTKAIAELPTQKNTKSEYVYYSLTSNIMINSVKVYNLDQSKWRNFDFIDYMNGKDKDNNNRIYQWIGTI